MTHPRPLVVVEQPATEDDATRDELVRVLAVAIGNAPLAASALDDARGRTARSRDAAAASYLRAWRRVAGIAPAPEPGSDLAALDGEQRSMLLLRLHLGWPRERIGVAHGCSASDVEETLHGAYRMLGGIDHDHLTADLTALTAAVEVPPPMAAAATKRRSRRLTALTATAAGLFAIVVWQAGGTGLDIPEPEVVGPAPSLAAAPLPTVEPAEGGSDLATAPLGPSLQWDPVRLPTGVRFHHVAVMDGEFYAIASARDLPGELGETFTTWKSGDGRTWSLVPGDSSAFGHDAILTDWGPGSTGLFAAGGRAAASPFAPDLVTEPTVWWSPTGRVWTGAALDTGLTADTPYRRWVFGSVGVAASDDATIVVATGSLEPDLGAIAGVGDRLPAGFHFGYDPSGTKPYLFGPGGVAIRELEPGTDAASDSLLSGGERRALLWRSVDDERWERIDLAGQIGAEVAVAHVQPLRSGFVLQGFTPDGGQASWFSADGRTWDVLDLGVRGPDPVGAVAEWAGATVARTAGGNVMLSTDGETWDHTTLPETARASTDYGQVAAGGAGILIMGSVFAFDEVSDEPLQEVVVPGDGGELVVDLNLQRIRLVSPGGDVVLQAGTQQAGPLGVDLDAGTVEVIDATQDRVVFSAPITAWQHATEAVLAGAPAFPVYSRIWYSADGRRWAVQQLDPDRDLAGLAAEAAVGEKSIVLSIRQVEWWPTLRLTGAGLWVGTPRD